MFNDLSSVVSRWLCHQSKKHIQKCHFSLTFPKSIFPFISHFSHPIDLPIFHTFFTSLKTRKRTSRRKTMMKSRKFYCDCDREFGGIYELEMDQRLSESDELSVQNWWQTILHLKKSTRMKAPYIKWARYQKLSGNVQFPISICNKKKGGKKSFALEN